MKRPRSNVKATKGVLVHFVEELACDVICTSVPFGRGWIPRDFMRIAQALEALDLIGKTNLGTRLARAFGYFPTILDVHETGACFSRLYFSDGSEPVSGVPFNGVVLYTVTCERCIADRARRDRKVVGSALDATPRGAP